MRIECVQAPAAVFRFLCRFASALLTTVVAFGAVAAEAAGEHRDGVRGDQRDGARGPAWTGFLELAAGTRIDGGDEPTTATLAELRGRVGAEWAADRWVASLEADLTRDQALHDTRLDLRELAVQFSAGRTLDVKAGRQVLTWGTGDLVFLNDLFPKDFESFFAGRGDEYLNAPSTALRLTAGGGWFDLDLVWTPEFEPDRYLDGERFSLFEAASGDIAVYDPPLSVDRPAGLDSGEVAVRLLKRVGAVELALYAHHGWFKQPTARNRRGRATFAPLQSAGFSVRAPVGAGRLNAEGSWYESRDDGNGDNPDVPNSQARWVLGYQRDLTRGLTAGLQYYGERLDDPAMQRATYPDPRTAPDKWRSVFTLRLTWRAPGDDLTLGLFALRSPSDDDYYLRPTATYRLGPDWRLSGGMNLFGGTKPYTAFGQFENNDNVYLRLRRDY